MRRKRYSEKQVQLIKEGVYDFYEAYEGDGTTDKICNYYVDKIRKYGIKSLTKKEEEIFNSAQKGKLTLDKPVYKRDKVTGDIAVDNITGAPIRIDQEGFIPGVPFITSKGKGTIRKDSIQARVYWNVGENFKMFYIFNKSKSNEDNPHGLTIWKSVKSEDNVCGAFIKAKGGDKVAPKDLWKVLDNKYHKGIIMDKAMYDKFNEFDTLFHGDKKSSIERIMQLYNELKNVGKK